MKGEGRELECFELDVGQTETERANFREEHEELWKVWDKIIRIAENGQRGWRV
jgi:hypothetical protein